MRDDVTIDVLTTVTVGVGVNMLTDLDVTAVVAESITLWFPASLSYAVDVLTDVWSGPSIDVRVLSGARVNFVVNALDRVCACVNLDVLTDVSENVVMAVMITALEFAKSPSSEE